MNFLQNESLLKQVCLEEHLRLNNKNQIHTNEILYLQSEWNYTHVFTSDNRKLLSSFTLKILEKRILNKAFIRINRGFLVNLNHVSQINESGRGGEVTLLNGSVFPISRRKFSTVKYLFENSI